MGENHDSLDSFRLDAENSRIRGFDATLVQRMVDEGLADVRAGRLVGNREALERICQVIRKARSEHSDG